MNITGIVVEYNPFHNGHRYHIQQAKTITNCDLLVAVMSGNWVQRGEPAVIDKWERAKIAVQNGVDLVLELPFLYATQSASEFAKGAIDILKQLHVDSIVFGSETNNLEELKEISEMSFQVDRFKENMQEGYSYPKSYGAFATSYGPNDILAIAYLKEIQNTTIKPYSILRTNNYHGTELTEIASASAIRTALLNGESVVHATPMHSMLNKPKTWEDYYPYIQTILLTHSREQLQKILLVDEGIEQHLKKQARISNTYAEFIDNCVVRRYTKSRIQRTLVHILTQTTKEEKLQANHMPYLRVLATNEKGRQHLKTLRKEPVVIANKYSQIPDCYKELEYRATVAYAIPFDQTTRCEIMHKEIYGQYK
ncbi:MAG: nucleotidyltransferase [Erysipelotrichaceae bacterium]|nr:nucleotidyltransferase [Erysipelotrichaceae bacterium]